MNQVKPRETQLAQLALRRTKSSTALCACRHLFQAEALWSSETADTSQRRNDSNDSNEGNVFGSSNGRATQATTWFFCGQCLQPDNTVAAYCEVKDCQSVLQCLLGVYIGEQKRANSHIADRPHSYSHFGLPVKWCRKWQSRSVKSSWDVAIKLPTNTMTLNIFKLPISTLKPSRNYSMLQ